MLDRFIDGTLGPTAVLSTNAEMIQINAPDLSQLKEALRSSNAYSSPSSPTYVSSVENIPFVSDEVSNQRVLIVTD